MTTPRATWKGVLQIALLQIPIKVYPATESSASLSFHQLHGACQSRLTTKRWCPSCDREVPSDQIVKGFEFEAGHYVVLLEDELEAVKPDSTRVIAVTRFAPAEQLEPRSVDRTYVLVPDGAVNGPADIALRTVQAALPGRVAIGTLAIYGREYLVAIGLQAGVVLLYTLHHAAELRALPTVESADRYLLGVASARRLFTAMTQPLDLADFTDSYQADVRRLIDAKIAGQEIVQPAAIEATGARLNLAAALEQSLRAVSRGTKIRASKTAAR